MGRVLACTWPHLAQALVTSSGRCIYGVVHFFVFFLGVLSAVEEGRFLNVLGVLFSTRTAVGSAGSAVAVSVAVSSSSTPTTGTPTTPLYVRRACAFRRMRFGVALSASFARLAGTPRIVALVLATSSPPPQVDHVERPALALVAPARPRRQDDPLAARDADQLARVGEKVLAEPPRRLVRGRPRREQACRVQDLELGSVYAPHPPPRRSSAPA